MAENSLKSSDSPLAAIRLCWLIDCPTRRKYICKKLSSLLRIDSANSSGDMSACTKLGFV